MSQPAAKSRERPGELVPESPPRPRLAAVAVAVAVALIVVAILLPPSSLLGKADVAGYAVCHRLPDRSYWMGGRPMPLCARCTGTFIGAVLGVAAMFLYGRRRASRLPPTPILLVLIAFFGVWAFDGLNSYLTFFPGAPHLYEPRNWLRLATGLLNGLALVTLVLPVFNFTLWREPSDERVIRNGWELLAPVIVAALVLAALQGGVEPLFYPLALLSGFGVVMMLTLINTMLAVVVLGREGYAWRWRQALAPLLVGAALAILEMTALVLVRAYLTAQLGLPF